MAIIGSIGVSVVARVGDFVKGMDKARRSARRTFRSIDRGVKSVVGFGSAVTAVVAGGSLAYLVNQQLQAVDATTKFADRLGITTERLGGLQYAADLTGVSTNNLQLGLQRMTRRIAEAAQGTGEARGALAELGLDAQELASQTPDEQFRRVADAMEGVANQGDRVRLAMKLFDSEGVALINTMRGGAEALDQMQAEAEALGLTFDRSAGAKIEMANDAITKLRGVAAGFGRTLAVELAPFITAAANGLVKLTGESGGMGRVVLMVMEKIATGIAYVADGLELGKAAFKGLQSAVTFGLSVLLDGASTTLGAMESILNLIPGIEISATSAIDEISKGLKDLASEQLSDATDALDNFSSGASSSKVKAFFDDIRREGDEAAAKAAEDAAARAAAAAAGAAAEEATSSLNVANVVRGVFDQVKDSAGSLVGSVLRGVQAVGGFSLRELEEVTQGAGLVERRFTSGFMPGELAVKNANTQTAENTKQLTQESRTQTQLLQAISDRLSSGSVEILSL